MSHARDPYPLRPVAAAEFDTWARTIADSYGEDRTAATLAAERAVIELDRTIGAFDGDTPVGGLASYTRTMTVPGAVQPVAGVTWVGVAPTHRRRGVLTSMTRRHLTGLYEDGREPVAVLNASEATVYGRFGYGIGGRGVRFLGDTRFMAFRPRVDTGRGTVRLLGGAAARPPLERVYETARTHVVGRLERPTRFWDARLHDPEAERGGATALRHAVHHEPDGAPTGYALYRLQRAADETGNRSRVKVVELIAATRQAYAALWRYLLDIDLHPLISYEGAPDEALPHLLLDARALRVLGVEDRLWTRLADVGRALAGRRYATALDVVLDVEDAFCPWNTGRHRLSADGEAVTCERTRDPAELRLSAVDLGAVHLGGTTLASLAAAGRVEELRPGAVARCTVAFRGEREPSYPGGAHFPAY